MIGVKPARELPVQRSRDRSGDRAVIGAVCEAALPAAPAPANLAASMKHTAAHMPSSWLSMPIEPGTRPGRERFSAHVFDRAGLGTGRPDHPRLVDLRRAGRPERPVVSIFHDPSRPSPVVRLGEFCKHRMADAHTVERYYSSGADRGSIIG